jgi:hypothetical protein
VRVTNFHSCCYQAITLVENWLVPVRSMSFAWLSGPPIGMKIEAIDGLQSVMVIPTAIRQQCP